jgi:hypothetical protein
MLYINVRLFVEFQFRVSEFVQRTRGYGKDSEEHRVKCHSKKAKKYLISVRKHCGIISSYKGEMSMYLAICE